MGNCASEPKVLKDDCGVAAPLPETAKEAVATTEVKTGEKSKVAEKEERKADVEKESVKVAEEKKDGDAKVVEKKEGDEKLVEDDNGNKQQSLGSLLDEGEQVEETNADDKTNETNATPSEPVKQEEPKTAADVSPTADPKETSYVAPLIAEAEEGKSVEKTEVKEEK